MEYRSCGFLILRTHPEKSFLLMEHADRLDLPKGHVDPGEDDRQCALRELKEETGISESNLRIEEEFRFELKYEVQYRRNRGQAVPKTLVIFMAWLQEDVEIQVTEHHGYRWQPWVNPPQPIQTLTIDPLLTAAAEFLSEV